MSDSTDKLPKYYCIKCGELCREEKIIRYYSRQTGEPIFRYRKICPRASFFSWHSDDSFDEDGKYIVVY